jgi:hypothetical protein
MAEEEKKGKRNEHSEAAENAASQTDNSTGGGGAAGAAAPAMRKPDVHKSSAPEHQGYAKGGAVDEKPDVKDIDADSIIDAFLDENPDLVDLPVDQWPEEAINMLKDTFNSENVDAPNGVLPEEEDAEGEPITEPVEIDTDTEPTMEPESDGEEREADDEGEPNPEQDFDIAALAELVEAGDKDGAWDMLQNMFGITPMEQPGPTNALDRMVGSEGAPKESGNALAKLIAGLKF